MNASPFVPVAVGSNNDPIDLVQAVYHGSLFIRKSTYALQSESWWVDRLTEFQEELLDLERRWVESVIRRTGDVRP